MMKKSSILSDYKEKSFLTFKPQCMSNERDFSTTDDDERPHVPQINLLWQNSSISHGI